ncbi:hypothetical protein CBD41_06880, partial [bacterium TMED181]
MSGRGSESAEVRLNLGGGAFSPLELPFGRGSKTPLSALSSGALSLALRLDDAARPSSVAADAGASRAGEAGVSAGGVADAAASDAGDGLQVARDGRVARKLSDYADGSSASGGAAPSSAAGAGAADAVAPSEKSARGGAAGGRGASKQLQAVVHGTPRNLRSRVASRMARGGDAAH